ncbi:MAG: transcriptional regulator [Candidatus Thermoplasmatota archaeon]|nr:transcriptional regulator [Candidatus Thermoplasmatota archaeon]MBU4255886.1 transcriptional regulator [Candidatus Thermoplasmatota archaeon]
MFSRQCCSVERQTLINGVRETLAKSGFYVSGPCNAVSFDIISRRDNTLLIIKVLTNVDAFSKPVANELKTLTKFLEASPLLIGEKSGAGEIEDDVIYLRHGVPIISKGTFDNLFLEGTPPLMYASPGGFYVRLDTDMIRRVREKKKISLGTLAEIAGVSRRAIQMYEEGMSAMVDVAVRLENFLGEPVVLPIDPFSYASETPDTEEMEFDMFEDFEKNVFAKLNEIGYRVVPIMRCPFNALTKDKKTLILTGIGRYDKPLLKKAEIVTNLSRVTEKHSVFFVEHSEKQNLEGTPLISISELKKINDPEKIVELILERKKG